MALERWVDFGPADWLTSDLSKNGPKGVTVGHCLPDGFDEYLKILHPMFIDRGDGTPRARVLWRELALESDLQFHPEVNARAFAEVFPEPAWPKNLTGPLLDDETCAALLDILGSFTDRQRCWFYYSGPPSSIEPHLFSGELRDLPDLREQEGMHDFPEYWWPEDHSWCLNSDDDLDFTLVGGPAQLVRLCVEHSGLEVLPVTLATRIDDCADEANARRRMRQVAESVLTDRMSLTLAAWAMHGLSRAAGSEFTETLAPFTEIFRQGKHLPVGAVRELWAPEALKSTDVEVRRIEAANSADARRACHEILSRVRL